ncbi:related to protoporphyrinogen oxidase [Cephalotrichum gorgonifer]|uniref:Related to protoporphyrinogen oxidase n=1 Tax=Cephalotrichum gorgonifer TaxID=2041049 RepID=A0AAE8MUB2_9PEZI|nr:related to protoporphyrinogen oxidase [Cephalotrichum gorgonifer]
MRTYLITGTRSGIGLEYVRQLSTSPDTTVVAVVRDVTADLTDLKSIISSPDTRAQIQLVEGNLTSPESITSLPSQLPQGLKIDVLIQNAGILLPSARSETASTVAIDSLNTHFSTNVIGPALVFQALVPHLAPGAVVANITSGLGSLTWNVEGVIPPGNPAYSISKTALNMLTVHQAAELKGKAIVVCIDPGWVKTQMGGPGAMVETADCARNVLRTLSMLKDEDTGKLMSNDGAPEPW